MSFQGNINDILNKGVAIATLGKVKDIEKNTSKTSVNTALTDKEKEALDIGEQIPGQMSLFDANSIDGGKHTSIFDTEDKSPEYYMKSLARAQRHTSMLRYQNKLMKQQYEQLASHSNMMANSFGEFENYNDRGGR